MTANTKQIDCRANWKSQTLYENTDRWQYRITDSEKAEIDVALKALKVSGKAVGELTSADFPLPTLSKKLLEIADFVENDYGVFLLRGVPVDAYSREDVRVMYAGLSTYWGALLAQSKMGELIGDVGDSGKSLKDKTGRGTMTKDPLPFHTDRSDVVTLLCLQQAKVGGQSRVVSSVAIYNEIVATRPDLIEALQSSYFHARVAWETEGSHLYYSLPLFSQYQGKFITRYLRHFTNMAQEIPEVPKMTPQQIEVLDLIEQLADNPDFCADMDFEPGDIQILNNFVSLHSRAGYEDDPENKRFLLRLWLSVPNSRALPPSFEPLYGNVGAGELRGGVPLNTS